MWDRVGKIATNAVAKISVAAGDFAHSTRRVYFIGTSRMVALFGIRR
jgi:hypothetical protein